MSEKANIEFNVDSKEDEMVWSWLSGVKESEKDVENKSNKRTHRSRAGLGSIEQAEEAKKKEDIKNSLTSKKNSKKPVSRMIITEESDSESGEQEGRIRHFMNLANKRIESAKNYISDFYKLHFGNPKKLPKLETKHDETSIKKVIKSKHTKSEKAKNMNKKKAKKIIKCHKN